MTKPMLDPALDPEIKAFLEKTASFYPADTASRSIDEQRHIYNSLCKAFHTGRPSGVNVRTHRVMDVPCRDYIPVQQDVSTKPNHRPQVVFLHGGGFVVGDLESHDDVCAELAKTVGLSLTSVNYALAPEHQHPTAFADCLAVVLTLFKTSQKQIILVGDSAGGNLAAALSHCLRAEKIIKGQVLIYPTLGEHENRPSFEKHAQAPLLSTDDMRFYQDVRVELGRPSQDPSYAPLSDLDFSGLPTTYIFAAEFDPLFDDALAYHRKIKEAKGTSHFFEEVGLVHTYLRARHTSKKAKEAFGRIVEAIKSLGDV